MYQKLFFGTMAVLLMALLASPALSQGKRQKFGLRGGINLAKTTTEGGKFVVPIDEGTQAEADVKIENRTTFGLGGFWEYWVSPMVAIQVNALYNKKGERENLQFSSSFSDSLIGETINISGNIEVPLELTYISFPVMGKLSFGKEGSARPYLMAGPEIGFLLSSGVGNVTGKFNLSIPALGINETVDNRWPVWVGIKQNL